MLSLGHRYPQQPHYIFVISRAATKFIARRFYQIFTQQPLDFGRFHTDTHTGEIQNKAARVSPSRVCVDERPEQE
jgi:hypothetical protein